MPRSKAFDEQAVLNRARDIFWERGYTATSIADLEEYLGIKRSSIYRFFGGKRALYDKTLAAYQETNLNLLRTALLGEKNLRVQLTELFTAAALHHDRDCQAGSRGCYVVNATTEMANNCQEALRFVADNRERFVGIMQKAVTAAIERGEIRPDADAKQLADYLFVCYNGLQVVVQTGIDRQALVAAVKTGVAALPWT